MDETKTSNPSPEKPTDKDYKKKRVEEIGSTLAQIKARVKANRSCARKDDDSKTSSREVLSEKSEKYIQVLELDKAKAQKLEKERPKIKEAIENLMIDREHQKLVEKKIEETRAKQSAPLPEIPLEVQKRISDLEITIHNLKETLSEKERVLESKTESWRLLSDQLEQRNLEVVDKYEVMAKEINEVKRSYAEQEVFLRNELEKYKNKLQDADSQLISQENWRRENEESKEELEELKRTHSECDGKLGEFQRSLEAEKKLCLKLKAQIKNYRNQINSKKDLTAEVERLQNQIATLEEEKEGAARNQEKLNQMESTLKSIETDLISTKEQCNRVNDDYNDLCTKLSEKEEMIRTLNESLQTMEQSKISSEFKAAELEEKLEAENREDRVQNDKMCKEIDNLKRHVKQQEEMVEELRSVIRQKEEEIKILGDNRDMDYSFAYDTQDLKDLLEEWKSKYTRIEETVRLVEEEKETLLVKVESLQIELHMAGDRCQNANSELGKKESVISDYAKKNNELVVSLKKATEKISELEHELSRNKKPESKNEDQTQKLKKLAANLKLKVKLCKELEEKIKELNEKIVQHEDTIALLTDEKTQLENIATEYKIKLENVSLDTDVVEQLKNLLSEKELIIQRFTEEERKNLEAVESEAVKRARKESQCELVERDSTIKHLKEENLILESKLNENMIEIHSVEEIERKTEETKVVNRLSQLELETSSLLEQVSSSTSQIKTLTEELDVKVKLIEELQRTVSELNSQLESANLLQNDTKSKLNEEMKLVNELKNDLNQLKSSKDLINSDLSNRSDLFEQMSVLQKELENSQKIISSKEEIISTFEHEINSLKSEISLNEGQLIKIQELYVEESNRNDGVITNIQSLESELNLSKNEIINLSQQLDEVSLNYAQCMMRLKEKDDYIDNLEKDLNGMRNKVQSLEATINERQKMMEERAKKLGEKLNEASSIGFNFEQYRIEMEQKINKFDETEKQLNSQINELVILNGELENNKKEAEVKVNELEGELNDIKSAYNTTLDQIEILNGELNQVMAQIEHRNKELVRIGEERNSLIGRLSELGDTCTDLKNRLQQHEEQSESLKSELDSKLKELDLATNEITNLQTQLGANQLTDNLELNKELEVLKTEYEERLRELQIEKDDLLKVIKGSVESEVDLLMKAAEDKVEKKEEIKLFSWEGHTENTPLDDMHDDSWGWNASEAKLEEEYQNSEANKLKQFEEEKEKLKTDNERLEGEVKSLKIKCTKLVAKIKELKTASEKGKSKTGFEDLDFAMQEELRSQVDEIDKKNKELHAELSTMKLEKERLTKRIDTLTSANNQLIEMKERQDIEVQVWQRNCAELKNQLQSFDWNENETKQEAEPAPSEIHLKSNSELEDKLSFLETENEELLQIICSLKDEKQANNNVLTELSNLREEHQKLKEAEHVASSQSIELVKLKELLEREKLDTQNKQCTIDHLIEEKNHLESSLCLLKKDLEASSEQCSSLAAQINNSSLNNEHFKSDCDLLKIELQNKNQQLTSLNEIVSSLKENINSLHEENSRFKSSDGEKDLELTNLRFELSQLTSAVKHIEGLQAEQLQLSNEIDRLKLVVESLTVDNESLRNSFNTKVAEMDLLKADMMMAEASKDAAINELQILRDGLSKDKSAEDIKKADPYEFPALSLFGGSDNSTPLFSMSNIFPANEPLVQSGSVGKTSSSPFNIPDSGANHDPFSESAASPPVFRGFVSDQSDSFAAAIHQQLDIQPQQNIQPSPNVFKSSEQNTQEVERTNLHQLQTLKEKLLQLEEENFNLIHKINSSQIGTNESNDFLNKTNDLLLKISEKDNEIYFLKTKVDQLNEEISRSSANYHAEKNELLKTNQELQEKLSTFQNTVISCEGEINRLKAELTEIRKQQANEKEQMRHDDEMRRQLANDSEQLRNSDMEALQRHLEEQLQQNERNFQNILLNKDEENAHLVCEISAKQAQCDKLSIQIEELNSQLNSLQNEVKLTKELNESKLNENALLKQDLHRLNFEIGEFRKVKESDGQLYAAQIDYLQQSIQEKEANIESLNARCHQLSDQVAAVQEELKSSYEQKAYLENCYSTMNTVHSQQTADYNAVHSRHKAAEEQIEQLNISVATLTQEVNEHRARLEQEKFSNESLRSKEAEQTRLLSSEIELLQSSITEKDLEIERLSKLLTGLQEKLIKSEESKISDEVLRLTGKLDKTLYTLHLRDVKCDELTVEIMHLLEERDSLQLRLSDALRINESLRKSSPQMVNPLSEPQPSLPESKSSHELNNKMGELHTGYMKDPAVREDRESRYSQQMHLFTSTDSTGTVEPAKKEESASSDYGILSWFFSSSTSPQPSQEPPT